MEDFSYIHRLNQSKMSTKNQIFEKLLADFKKSNKTRKEKLAHSFGFPSADAYLAHLEGNLVEENIGKSDAPVLIDKVIAFDTTGSMAMYINEVRAFVRHTIPELFRTLPNLRLKIVAFGDFCDMTSPSEFGIAYQETGLTNDENLLIDFVNTASDTGGGDTDEFYEVVISKIVRETPWREGSNRSVMLIGDSQPHIGQYECTTRNGKRIHSSIDWKEEARNAHSMGIQFDTLAIHEHYTFYSELSKITNGVHMPFKSSKHTTEAVMASTFVRGDKMSKEIFEERAAFAATSGDVELDGLYKSLRTKL